MPPPAHGARVGVVVTVGALAACGAFGASDDGEAVGAVQDAAGADGMGSGDADAPDQLAPTSDAGADSAAEADVVGRKRVFATSATFAGGFGGADNATSLCNSAAQAVGAPAKFVAWVAATGTDPYSQLVAAGGPWYLMDRTTLAASFSSAPVPFPGRLEHAIDHDENGAPIPGTDGAWTGISQTGGSIGPRCLEWIEGSTAATGAYGTVGAVGEAWTNTYVTLCDNRLHLYCFER